MATNYKQPGKVLTLTAPYARSSGEGALVESIFGVALNDVLIAVETEFATTGVWTLAKTSAQAWAVGDEIYWDDGNKRCDNVPTVGALIGSATAVAANPSSTGEVKLNGTAVFSTPGLGLTAAELSVLDGAGPGGTPVASKAQIADANQNIGAVKATSVSIGATGAEVSITATPAEIDLLAGAGPGGTPVASKAQIADANQNIGAVKATSVSIGATGAEVALTATPAELNGLASAATGLGSSNSYVNTDVGVKTLLAAHATKDRGALVVVTIDEAFADGGGAQPTVKIGEADTDDKVIGTAAFAAAVVGLVAGDQLVFGFTNLSTKAIIATLVAAGGAGTGGFSVLVLALPNT